MYSKNKQQTCILYYSTKMIRYSTHLITTVLLTPIQCKMYNIDLPLPIYPMQFPSFIHSQKRNPQTHMKDPDMVWDFWSLRPESLHQVAAAAVVEDRL